MIQTLHVLGQFLLNIFFLIPPTTNFFTCVNFFFTSSKSSSQYSPNVQPSQVANKRLQLQQDDINGPCGPSKPPSSPSPSHAANPHPQSQSCDCQPSVRPAGRLFPCWELHFITEKNCLIVKTQLPPSSFFHFTGEGGFFCWTWGHHAVTRLQGSLHPLFARHLT